MLTGLFGQPQRAWWRPAVRTAALAVPLASCAGLATARDSVPAAIAVLILVLWVVAAAATGDRVAGVLAALSGAAWFDFFLTEPYLRFAIRDSHDIQVAVLLVGISLLVTEIALWGHRQQADAARRSGYLDGLVRTAGVVAQAQTPKESVVEVVGRQVSEVLGADGFEFVAGPVHDERIAVLSYDGSLTRGGHPVNVDRVGLPTDEYVAVLVRRGPLVVGHLLLTATSHVSYPNAEQRRVAVLLADQLAGALVRDSS